MANGRAIYRPKRKGKTESREKEEALSLSRGNNINATVAYVSGGGFSR
jgi:hypothetical protein